MKFRGMFYTKYEKRFLSTCQSNLHFMKIAPHFKTFLSLQEFLHQWNAKQEDQSNASSRTGY